MLIIVITTTFVYTNYYYILLYVIVRLNNDTNDNNNNNNNNIIHCSGPVCTRSKSKDSSQGQAVFLLCVKGESGVATVEAARRHAH